MQIVRDLAGYTMGRSDLVRKAMSKKKADVMERERQNFVYGNDAENIKGCIANGIDEKTANHIYDTMIDFAKYAFNKSHAAAYAVVSYQTAYLKYYYPKEYMAALMTSVMDNTTKVSEYILSCRQMNISILPPDINEGESGFSVSNGSIRYGLSAIKSVGKSVVDVILQERKRNGKFESLEDFVDRMSNREVNRRTLENFIKSGALDTLPGTRKQKMMVAGDLLEQKAKEKKASMAGQLSLFDFAAEEDKSNFRVTFPNVGEFEKEELLANEKDTLGVYVSGHPMQEYENLWRKNITATSLQFIVEEETGKAQVEDGVPVTIGGMITGKTVKLTKTNKMMAFLTIEDLVGSVEVLVFPKDYESKRDLLNEEAKVFIRGRSSMGDDPIGKVILEQVIPFDTVPRELWIQYPDKAAWDQGEKKFMDLIQDSDGNSRVVIWLEKEKGMKRLPPSCNVKIDSALLNTLIRVLGEKNVKVVEKTIEKMSKMN